MPRNVFQVPFWAEKCLKMIRFSRKIKQRVSRNTSARIQGAIDNIREKQWYLLHNIESLRVREHRHFPKKCGIFGKCVPKAGYCSSCRVCQTFRAKQRHKCSQNDSQMPSAAHKWRRRDPQGSLRGSEGAPKGAFEARKGPQGSPGGPERVPKGAIDAPKRFPGAILGRKVAKNETISAENQATRVPKYVGAHPGGHR